MKPFVLSDLFTNIILVVTIEGGPQYYEVVTILISLIVLYGGRMIDWKSVEVESVLNIDWHIKYIALLVKISSEAHPKGAKSILLAHKQGFDSSADLLSLLQSTENRGGDSPHIKLLDHNDIYYRFIVGREANIMLIHPATEMHIQKYTKQERHLIQETSSQYRSITEPWILARGAKQLQWVENILEGRSEQDRILFHDKDPNKGFVLLPDSKWDQQSICSLYLLAIAMNREIRSLRDINSSHLPLLKAIRDAVETLVPSRYPAIKAGQLRIYVHYLPTYYYFHVHIVHVDYEMAGCAVGAAHLLNDIIDNVENIDPNYYQRRTLTIVLGKEHDLFLKHAP